MRKAPTITVMLFTALFALPAHSLKLTPNSELHGFVNQAFLYSPDNPYAGEDSLKGSFDFREAGLNGFIEATPELRFAGQIIARQRDEANDGDVRVDFLLADYLFFSQRDYSLGVRIGRVKNNIGLYNATRDIPSSSPGYNVPESIYFDSFRDTIISTDGINLYGSALFAGNKLNWDIYAGRKSLDSMPLEYYVFDRPVERGHYEDVTLYGLNIDFMPAAIPGLELGFSTVDLQFDLEDTQSDTEALTEFATIPPSERQSQLNRYITGNRIEALLSIFSAQYSVQNWILSAEYLYLDSDTRFETPVFNDERETVTEGYYGQAEWLPNPQGSVFVRYEELYLDRDNRSFSGLGPDYNPHKGFGKGWTLGGRWNFQPNLSITTQASFNEGTVWLPSYNGMEDKNFEKYWNYYVISLNYQF